MRLGHHSQPGAMSLSATRNQHLEQWFLNFTNTPNLYVVFQAFAEPDFCPI